jgi:putative endopeptidase
MPRFRVYALCLALSACAGHPPAQVAPRSGIDLKYVDASVRPQDDAYQYLNGKWLRDFQLPADKGAYGSFTAIEDKTQIQLRRIVDGLDSTAATTADPDAKKLADLYASFMNEAQLEALGLTPLQAEFAAIDAAQTMSALPALIAHLQASGAGAPFGLGINLDARNSTQYAVILSQSGLGMPDRDYYLKDDPKLKETRAKYLAHIHKMLSMAGDPQAAANAAAILALETSLARIQWTRVRICPH